LLRKYEILYILRHDSAPDVTQGAIDKVKGAITDQGGTILLHESWGKKKLAYEIQKAAKGIYQLTTFAGEPTTIREIEHVLRINPEVMKWLTVQLN
jgi:small subunit ribosomal protein S6